jgi:hypothetical protein
MMMKRATVRSKFTNHGPYNFRVNLLLIFVLLAQMPFDSAVNLARGYIIALRSVAVAHTVRLNRGSLFNACSSSFRAGKNTLFSSVRSRLRSDLLSSR